MRHRRHSAHHRHGAGGTGCVLKTFEVGRAQRTIFVARYLRSRDLQREITEGLGRPG
ncbi:MAG: Tn3 family transposase [Streptosporangiales bacterium]|nr:Tn3 family transposase [Streptosporangiales bacterium]